MGAPNNSNPYLIPPLWQTQFAVTASNTVDLTTYSHGLWVTGAGAVAIVTPDGTAVTYTVQANTFIGHVMVRRVNVTNTTATGLVGGY